VSAFRYSVFFCQWSTAYPTTPRTVPAAIHIMHALEPCPSADSAAAAAAAAAGGRVAGGGGFFAASVNAIELALRGSDCTAAAGDAAGVAAAGVAAAAGAASSSLSSPSMQCRHCIGTCFSSCISKPFEPFSSWTVHAISAMSWSTAPPRVPSRYVLPATVRAICLPPLTVYLLRCERNLDQQQAIKRSKTFHS
jgi:hypothetical protein